MRVMTDRDLETVSGGDYNENQTLDGSGDGGGGGAVGNYVNSTGTSDGYEVTPTSMISGQQLDDYQNAAQSMDASALGSYVADNATADFGLHLGPITITPIFNPYAGTNDIRYGGKAKVHC